MSWRVAGTQNVEPARQDRRCAIFFAFLQYLFGKVVWLAGAWVEAVGWLVLAVPVTIGLRRAAPPRRLRADRARRAGVLTG